MKTREGITEIQQFQLAEFDIKQKLNKLAQEVEKQRMAKMKQVLREIRAAITFVAKSNNLDLVMRAPEYDDEGAPSNPADAEERERDRPRTSAQLVRRFRENPVLFYSPKIDITSTTIKKLNDDYGQK